MVLGIDASNILAGGGLVHLKELLAHVQPSKYGFKKVVLWAPQNTLNQLPDYDWLIKKTHSWLNKNVLYRMLWHSWVFPRCLGEIDVLFMPGANPVRFHKTVSMCQNLLPFDDRERALYGFSWMTIRLMILTYTQTKAFKRSRRVIFLTPSSIQYVCRIEPTLKSKAIVIPHGVKNDIRQHALVYKHDSPRIKLLYVSIVDVYKHQWNVVRALFNLLDKGYDVELKLVGSHYKPAMDKLNEAVMSRPEYADKVSYSPFVTHHALTEIYQEADIFVFASSCETFSLILLEAMASGLPIACSDRDTLKDTLKDAGVYFDPYNAHDIEHVLFKLIQDKHLREELRKRAHLIASSYTWEFCSDLTFKCLSEVGAEKLDKK